MKAEIFRYSNWLSETSPDFLRITLQKALECADFKILAHQEHHFTPQGYTCLWLLGESHLAVHTFPEEEVTYLELSSCNETKQLLFVDIIERECSITVRKEVLSDTPVTEQSKRNTLV